MFSAVVAKRRGRFSIWMSLPAVSTKQVLHKADGTLNESLAVWRIRNPAIVVCDCSSGPGCNIWTGGVAFDFHFRRGGHNHSFWSLNRSTYGSRSES
jgi:hypothetical protein